MRQYLLDRYPDPAGQLRLEGDAWHYLAGVRRLREGNVIEGRLPDGRTCRLRVVTVNRRERFLQLKLDGPCSENAESPDKASVVRQEDGFSSSLPHIILLQWIIKGQRMDLVVRQATETGVARIIPVTGDRCLASESGHAGRERTARWQRITREARQQSGSPVDTRVYEPLDLEKALALTEQIESSRPVSSLRLVLSEEPLARESLHRYLVDSPETVTLAVGPEGGMTPGEMERLQNAGFCCVHFRTNVLRAETAALYGIAAVQTALTERVSWQPNE